MIGSIAIFPLPTHHHHPPPLLNHSSSSSKKGRRPPKRSFLYTDDTSTSTTINKNNNNRAHHPPTSAAAAPHPSNRAISSTPSCSTRLTALLYAPRLRFPATCRTTSAQSTCRITLSAARCSSCEEMPVGGPFAGFVGEGGDGVGVGGGEEWWWWWWWVE